MTLLEALLTLVCVGSVKTPHRIPLCPSVIQPFPEPFLPLLKTMASCVPLRKAAASLAHNGLDILLSHMAVHMLTSLHLLAGN